MRETEKPTAEGESFGPYIVYERLGTGGMATVHRALEQGIAGFQREVALKRLLPAFAEDEDFVAAFVREAKLASLLSHANIVKIFELGRVGTSYFISMEYIPGSDVRKILKQARRAAGPPPLTVVVSLLSELCDALDYAHNHTDGEGEPLGLVHRDISPSNLLVSSAGHLKIIDFGIAKATTLQLRTQSGRIKGKLSYMAPEAIAGGDLDARSDIFSAGVIAHELLTATPLFASRKDFEVIQRIRQAEVAPPGEFNPRVPEELDALVLRALAKDPGDRWQSAAEMRAALEELAHGYQLHATDREVLEWIEWAFALEPEKVAQREPGRDRDTASGSYEPEPKSPSYERAHAGEPVHSFLEAAEPTDPAQSAGDLTAPEGEVEESTSERSEPPDRADTRADEYSEPPTLYEPREEKTESSYDEVPTVYQPREQRAPRGDAPETRGTSRQSVPPIPTPQSQSFAHLVSFGDGEAASDDMVTTPSSKNLLARAIEEEVGPERSAPAAEPPAPPATESGQPEGDEEDEEHARRTVDKPRAQSKGAASQLLRLGAVGALLAAAAFSAALYLRSQTETEEAPRAASPDPAQVRFIVEPPDAEVLIDGVVRDSPMELAPGVHEVEVQREGYRPWLTEIDVAPAETQTVRVALRPLEESPPSAPERPGDRARSDPLEAGEEAEEEPEEDRGGQAEAQP